VSGFTLTVASTLTCPHGGTVQIVTGNARAKVGGAPAALATDTYLVSGCPFQLPTTPPTPSPCVRVQWAVPDIQVQVGGAATLSQGSAGLCLSAMQAPQGPVVVVAGQARTRSR
jgi:hypothetical protein